LRQGARLITGLSKDINMAANPFHLGWFLQGSSIQALGQQWTGNISEE
jgi:hypothetical protein